jgi:hypothetical protein
MRSCGRPQRPHLVQDVGNHAVRTEKLQSRVGHQAQQQAGKPGPLGVAGQALQPLARTRLLHARQRPRQPPPLLDGRRVARGDRALLVRIAIEVAVLRVSWPPVILVAAYPTPGHRHQDRRTRRVRTAIAQEPSPRPDLLMMLHDRRRRAADQRRAAITSERRAQQRILARRQYGRRVDPVFRGDVQHAPMLRVAAANGVSTRTSRRASLGARQRQSRTRIGPSTPRRHAAACALRCASPSAAASTSRDQAASSCAPRCL